MRVRVTQTEFAQMVKLVNTQDSGSCAERLTSSSLVLSITVMTVYLHIIVNVNPFIMYIINGFICVPRLVIVCCDALQSFVFISVFVS